MAVGSARSSIIRSRKRPHAPVFRRGWALLLGGLCLSLGSARTDREAAGRTPEVWRRDPAVLDPRAWLRRPMSADPTLAGLGAFRGRKPGWTYPLPATPGLDEIVYTEQSGLSGGPLEGVDVLHEAAPTFVDIDADGDYDAFIGRYGYYRYSENIQFFENTGDVANPQFVRRQGADNPLGFASNFFYLTPAFVDIDDDGDYDCFVGQRFGGVDFFENIGSPAAPAFTERFSHPLDFVDVGYFSDPLFADIDDDGDLDAFSGDLPGGVHFFENTGTPAAATFDERFGVDNPLDLVAVGSLSSPDLVDVDDDGDLDAFVGESDGSTAFYRNIGSAMAPAFVEQTGVDNPMNGRDVPASAVPAFVDLDADGDSEVMVGIGGFYTETSGQLAYFANIGTPSEPFLVPAERNPLADVLTPLTKPIPALVDLDGDGDQDAFVGDDGVEGLQYWENVGSRVAAVMRRRFGADHPLDEVDGLRDPTPTFVDLDGDGDSDAVIGSWDGFDGGAVYYWENVGDPGKPIFEERSGTENPFDAIDERLNIPEFADIDSDGDPDLFLGVETSGSPAGIRFYENVGTPRSPRFVQRTGADNPADGIDTSPFSADLAIVDVDFDCDRDLLIGASGEMRFFENTGDVWSPVLEERFDAQDPFSDIGFDTVESPAFGDMDGDGDADLFLGNSDLANDIAYYRNETSAVPLTLAARRPIVVPPGGEARARFGAHNNTDTALALEVWLTVTDATGTEIRALGPRSLELDPGESISRIVRVALAPSDPVGAYSLNVFVGTFPSDIQSAACLPFNKR